MNKMWEKYNAGKKAFYDTVKEGRRRDEILQRCITQCKVLDWDEVTVQEVLEYGRNGWDIELASLSHYLILSK